MKNILLIGVGGTGSRAVDFLTKKMKEMDNKVEHNIQAVVFDTDEKDIADIANATSIPMTDIDRLGAVCDRIGSEVLKEWFPCDDFNVRSQELRYGASQWRKKSYFAFVNLMSKDNFRQRFTAAIDSLRSMDPSAPYEIFTVSSIAGGTGSGSFIPITLYAKKYIKTVLGKDALSTAFVACPDIYIDSQPSEEQKTKIYSNAYAIMRELNAMNLVTHGYNDLANKTDKHPLVNIKIGSPTSPVGVLFDSSDKEYWKPEAAPFDSVFLLDKIPGLNTPVSHDIVLANSLYTVLCTGVGQKIDSERSNHETVRSQDNNSNAIYGGIATSEIKYPIDSIVNYIAHQKTLDSCNDEWMTLYNEIDKQIEEEREKYARQRKAYTTKAGDYARKVVDYIDRIKTSTNENEERIYDLIRRGSIDSVLVDNKIVESKRADDYYKLINETLMASFPSLDTLSDGAMDGKGESIPNVKLFKKIDSQAEDFVARQRGYIDSVNACYGECINFIRDNCSISADRILPVNGRSEADADKVLSLVSKLLQKDGNYVHPVTALALLCQLRVAILNYTETAPKKWDVIDNLSIKSFDDTPDNLYDIDTIEPTTKNKKPVYGLNTEETRLKTTLDESSFKANSNFKDDADLMYADFVATLKKVYKESKNQYISIILRDVGDRIENLINSYKEFFAKFEDSRSDLEALTQDALKQSSKNNGSVINVAATVDNKINAYKEYVKMTGVGDEQDLIKCDNVSGKGVFAVAYGSTLTEYRGQKNSKDKKSSYDGIFSAMIKEFSSQVKASKYYKILTSKNLIQIIADLASNRNDIKEVIDVEAKQFKYAVDMSTPSLRSDNYKKDDDTSEPSNIVVILFPAEIGEYLKNNAETYGLSLGPDAKPAQATEEFLRKIGIYKARVELDKRIQKYSIYCTQEIVDVQPEQVKKINETSAEAKWYASYKVAIASMEKYHTDLWNPHLGFNFHKRGNLPLINKGLERENDKKLAKALLYALYKHEFTYSAPKRQEEGFRISRNGIQELIKVNGNIVNKTNLSGLIKWLRLQEDLIAKWSDNYDDLIKEEMTTLPRASGENIALKSNMTKNKFIEFLRDDIFKSLRSMGDSKDFQIKYNLIDFCYEIKNSEEADTDCDDAEKILTVGFETLVKFCAYRCPMDTKAGDFSDLYQQQLDNFMLSLAKAHTTNGEIAKEDVTVINDWLYESKVFGQFGDKNDTLNEKTPLVKYDFSRIIAATEEAKEAREKAKAEEAKAKAESSEAVANEANA